MTTTTTPTIDQIISATGGQESRDGQSVVISYGRLGYARITPDYITRDGAAHPAAKIDTAVKARKGGIHAEIRRKLESAGIYPL